MLLGATVAVIGTVVGLRSVIAPDQPTFGDAVEASQEEGEPFLPEAEGGEFTVTGDRDGSFSLSESVGPPGHGLGGDDARMHFEQSDGQLVVVQFSYDGLDFFPEEGECAVTPGEVNSARGVAAAQVDCPQITDIRDTATITVEGRVGLPAAMVTELDLPEVGGTFTAGDETWEVAAGQFLVFEDENVTPSGTPMALSGFEFSLEFAREDGSYHLARIHYQGSPTDIPPTACSVRVEELGALGPDTVRLEVDVDCTEIDIQGLGEVPVRGSAVVDQITIGGP
ncbi:MAG: hypothetical protein ACLFWM_09775 [Actinomycetota bacterium]